jgi:hypothetical protein
MVRYPAGTPPYALAMATLGRYDDLRSEDTGRPVAAQLPVAAELLGVPLPRVLAASARVDPYRHADGSPRWSVKLLERELGRVRLQPQERREQRRQAKLAAAAEG